MAEITVTLPDDLERELRKAAAVRNVAPEALFVDAVEFWLSEAEPAGVAEAEAAYDPELDMSPFDPRAEAIARSRGMSEEAIAAIKAGLEDIKAGRTHSHEEVFTELRARFGG